MTSDASISEVLTNFSERIQERFKREHRVLTFSDFLAKYREQPYQLSRHAAAYMADMMDFFGRRTIQTPLGERERFRLFDAPFEDHSIPPVVDHEEVQIEFYNVVRSFIHEGHINKLILLHGPNGSAKSSIFRCLIAGLEHYSRQPEGTVYSFNWVFPIESVYKKSIGLGAKPDYLDQPGDSYAHLDPEKISTIIPNEMKDNPVFLLPLDIREKFLIERLASIESEQHKKTFKKMMQYLMESNLSDKSNQIFEALLTSYKGDYKKVLMHVQVERIYFSKRFQSGAVTVDPQMNVDAHARQVTMNRSLAYIPPALQSLNLFSLDGPLIQANRGLIEFNDLLKRPIEAFKYLLGTCETGIVSVGPSLAYLDQVMAGSCNEVQMEVFRDYPDFPSFRARMEFVKVPYLLRYSKEKEVYDQVLPGYKVERHASPYTTEVLALWAVLTRLRKPQLPAASSVVRRLLESLSALEKAKFYDSGEVPSRFTNEEAKEFRAHIRDVYEEYQSVSGYEGRFGASAREMKMLLYNAAHADKTDCVSPGKVIDELEHFVDRKSEYEFLRQEASGGYHAHRDFVEITRDHYLSLADRDFKLAMGLAAESQYPQILEKYAANVKAHLRGEKTKNDLTGLPTDPDLNYMTRTETMLDINRDREQFRKDIITNIAAWAHDHPGQALDYAEIFPDYIKRIKKHFHEEQRKTVMKSLHAILDRLSPERAETEKNLDKKTLERAEEALQHLESKQGYCRTCIGEAASYLMKYKYQS